MTLKENPFYILGVSPRDNKRKIMDAAEEKLLFMDADVVENAKNDLLDSNRRLDAELGWFVGLDSKTNNDIVKNLNEDLFSEDIFYSLVQYDKLNYLLEWIRIKTNDFYSENSALPLMKVVQKISNIYEKFISQEESIAIQELKFLINNSRIHAGFSIIDTNILLEKLYDRKENVVAILLNAIDKMSSNLITFSLFILAEIGTRGGRQRASIIIESILMHYEVSLQQFINVQIEKIYSIINPILDEHNDKNFIENNLSSLTDKLFVYIKVWNRVIEPIEVFHLSKGKEHRETSHILHDFRNVCLKINNDYNMPKLALKLLHQVYYEASQCFFLYIPSFKQLFKDDIKILTDMVKKQEEYERQEAEEKKKYEKWAKSIYYETEFGLIFKDKFKISADGIEYDGRTTPLNDIIGISWGGITNYWNSVPTGTDYTIRFKTLDGETAINPNEDQYKHITECLWKAVSLNIFTNMLKQLENGETLKVGNIKVIDTGVYLIKSGWFSSEEKIFPWNKITTYSQDGLFYLREKDGKHKASSSYMGDMNTHILDFMIRLFFKNFNNSSPNISSLLYQ